jgi:choline dehydrogenase-like flavoprotein
VRETSADVVIIGSGAGGGTVAKELAPLARAGRRVVALADRAAESIRANAGELLRQ